MFNLFKRKAEPAPETRAAQDGFTGQVMALRENWLSGQTGLADLTATVQAAVGLWEGALAASHVDGTDLTDAGCHGAGGAFLGAAGRVLVVCFGQWFAACTGLRFQHGKRQDQGLPPDDPQCRRRAFRDGTGKRGAAFPHWGGFVGTLDRHQPAAPCKADC